MSPAEALRELDDVAATEVVDELPSLDTTSQRAEQEALAAELAQAREVLDALSRDLRAVDDELAGLATEREQHRIAVDVCASLDKLSALGGAAVFWGDGADADENAQYVRHVRARVDLFAERVGAIELRRAGVIERISQQQGHAAFMEDILFEALEEEERLKQEWIVEREISKLPAYKAAMPWTHGSEDDKRFRKSVSTALLICLLFAIVVPFIALPVRITKPDVEIPERIVQLLIESRPKPPTPARELPRPKPEEQKLAEQKPQETRKNAPKIEEKVPEPTAGEGPKVADQGILAFRDKFASAQQDEALARLGNKAQIDNSGDAGPVQRAMLTTNAPGSSGGINLAALSRGVGGTGGQGGMARVQVTRVSSGLGGIGKPGADRPLSGDNVGPSRTDEEIQIVFDRYKSALYRLYNKELRKDPTLRGQMVLKLTIEPDGSVSMCMLQGSDMNAPDLSAQVVDRVKTINFGAKDVPAITILYPIDFLPAA